MLRAAYRRLLTPKVVKGRQKKSFDETFESLNQANSSMVAQFEKLGSDFHQVGRVELRPIALPENNQAGRNLSVRSSAQLLKGKADRKADLKTQPASGSVRKSRANLRDAATKPRTAGTVEAVTRSIAKPIAKPTREASIGEKPAVKKTPATKKPSGS